MVKKKKRDDNYISLQDATKYCSYSQEYLSLRARQGKLKAEKFGRNWVTKKTWLKEYIAMAEEYNNNLETFRVRKLKKAKKEIWPPANLPIGEFDERELIPVQPPPLPGLRPVEKIRTIILNWAKPIRISSTGFRFAFATALVFVLLIAGGVFVLPNFVKQNLGGLFSNKTAQF